MYDLDTNGAGIGVVRGARKQRFDKVLSHNAARAIARRASEKGGGMQVGKRDNVRMRDSIVNGSNHVVGSERANVSEQRASSD